MNNMKYYNESLAYDFEMFAPRPEKNKNSRDNIVVMPRKANATKKRKKAAIKAVHAPALAVMTAIFVLAGVCGNIALRLKINEVNEEINSVKSAIAEVDSEKTVLQVEMQRRISYANLEYEAMQLGMKKPEKSDVVYIRINDKDAAKTADGRLLVSE
ncbi:MAG: hypothetical protein ACOYJS_02180 [Acutalibacteraceae bacterium]|jgi:cell division protein FtsL